METFALAFCVMKVNSSSIVAWNPLQETIHSQALGVSGMFMNEVLLHFHLQLVSLYTSSDLWLNSLCFQLVDVSRDFAHVFDKEEKSSLGGHPARGSGCSSFAKPVATSLDASSQRRWPGCPPQVASRSCRPSPVAQVHLHHVCEKSNTPLSSRMALRLNSAKSTKTLPMLRRTRRTFHRHAGRGPTSSGMSRNGLRPSPEQRTPSQKACHPQSQPARVIEGVAIVGVKPAGGHISAAMRRQFVG